MERKSELSRINSSGIKNYLQASVSTNLIND